MITYPARDDQAAWDQLATMALQAETFRADMEESRAWEATMRGLLAERLDYETFTERRLEALKVRVRARKLAQSNLRYKYGFRHRSASLVRLDVKRWIRENAGE